MAASKKEVDGTAALSPRRKSERLEAKINEAEKIVVVEVWFCFLYYHRSLLDTNCFLRMCLWMIAFYVSYDGRSSRQVCVRK